MAKQYDILIRLLLIGDSGVGKTCLMCRFVENEFDKAYISTIGIDFKMKTLSIEGKKVKIQIWDTAGQERYETITRQYYRRAQGILLVYDMQNEESFENISKWIELINEYAPEDVQLMLIGNKCDEEDKRVITKPQGEELAKKYNIESFMETSAYIDKNIDETFVELTRLVMEKNKIEIDKQLEGMRLYGTEDDVEDLRLDGQDDESYCCLIM